MYIAKKGNNDTKNNIISLAIFVFFRAFQILSLAIITPRNKKAITDKSNNSENVLLSGVKK